MYNLPLPRGFEKFRIKICYTYTIAPYLCVRSDAKVAMLK